MGGEGIGFVFETPESLESRLNDKRIMDGLWASQNECCKELKFNVWTSDHSIYDVQNLQRILAPFGVSFSGKSSAKGCTKLPICDTKAGSLGIKPEALAFSDLQGARSAFAKENTDKVDAFLCIYPASMCELFMDKPGTIIVLASKRISVGRETETLATRWKNNLAKIASDKKNVVAATNLYDAMYIEYVSGLKNVMVIPNFPFDFSSMFAQQHDPSRGDSTVLFWSASTELRVAASAAVDASQGKAKLVQWSTKLSQGSHKALVLVPDAVTSATLYDSYCRGLPVFVPSALMLVSFLPCQTLRCVQITPCFKAYCLVPKVWSLNTAIQKHFRLVRRNHRQSFMARTACCATEDPSLKFRGLLASAIRRILRLPFTLTTTQNKRSARGFNSPITTNGHTLLHSIPGRTLLPSLEVQIMLLSATR